MTASDFSALAIRAQFGVWLVIASLFPIWVVYRVLLLIRFKSLMLIAGFPNSCQSLPICRRVFYRRTTDRYIGAAWLIGRSYEFIIISSLLILIFAYIRA